MKRNEGRRRQRCTPLAGAKKGRKNVRKGKKKNGGSIPSQQQQQQQQQRSAWHSGGITNGGSKQGTLKKMKTFETLKSTPYSLETCASSLVTSVMKAITWCLAWM